MHRKLTITVEDEVYQGLHRKIGRGQISRFVEDLIRPHVVEEGELAAAYRAMVADEEAEREAQEWVEGLAGETLE